MERRLLLASGLKRKNKNFVQRVAEMHRGKGGVRRGKFSGDCGQRRLGRGKLFGKKKFLLRRKGITGYREGSEMTVMLFQRG